MKKSTTPPDENFKIRCPRLGHQIHFSYCRRENSGLPCRKILDCWSPHFMVMEFLHRELSSQEWEDTFAKPRRPKLLSLVELIEQAKQRKKQEKN